MVNRLFGPKVGRGEGVESSGLSSSWWLEGSNSELGDILKKSLHNRERGSRSDETQVWKHILVSTLGPQNHEK